MQRYGRVIKIKQNKICDYIKLHSNIWPEVAKAIKDYNLRNFSIYHKDGFLFSYFEYTGKDYDKDMKLMSSVPIVRKWLKITDAMQEPLRTRKHGEWWANMEEVFHID